MMFTVHNLVEPEVVVEATKMILQMSAAMVSNRVGWSTLSPLLFLSASIFETLKTSLLVRHFPLGGIAFGDMVMLSKGGKNDAPSN